MSNLVPSTTSTLDPAPTPPPASGSPPLSTIAEPARTRFAPKDFFARLMARRRSIDSVVIGVLLTLLVISVDSAGVLTQVEFLLYDLRASTFQFFLPKPTDKLVHLDVDEGVLQAVAASEDASWPWPRSLLAEMFDEIQLAQPKVVGLDILFPLRL
jgi:CHASE2 domain-containing sensor protein